MSDKLLTRFLTPSLFVIYKSSYKTGPVCLSGPQRHPPSLSVSTYGTAVFVVSRYKDGENRVSDVSFTLPMNRA